MARRYTKGDALGLLGEVLTEYEVPDNIPDFIGWRAQGRRAGQKGHLTKRDIDTMAAKLAGRPERTILQAWRVLREGADPDDALATAGVGGGPRKKSSRAKGKGMHNVSIGGSGFSIGSLDVKTAAEARKVAIEFASQLPQSRSGRRSVGVSTGKKGDGYVEVTGFFIPMGGDKVAEYGSEFEVYSGFSPKEHKAPSKVRALPDAAMDAIYQLAGRKRGPRSTKKQKPAAAPKRKTSRRKAPAKKRTSRKKAPAKKAAPRRSSVAKRGTRAARPKDASKYWFFELSDGTYGDVKSRTPMTRAEAAADVRDSFKLGPRAKVSLRKKRPKWAD
jgi:hypothetical protein